MFSTLLAVVVRYFHKPSVHLPISDNKDTFPEEGPPESSPPDPETRLSVDYSHLATKPSPRTYKPAETDLPIQPRQQLHRNYILSLGPSARRPGYPVEFHPTSTLDSLACQNCSIPHRLLEPRVPIRVQDPSFKLEKDIVHAEPG